MTIVREMREEDADAVRAVEAIGFGAWWKQSKGESAELPQRTRMIVQANRDKDPAGCFVAEEDGRVVGFIFSRTWGSVGWFGTFSVLPEYQRRGIGNQRNGHSEGQRTMWKQYLRELIDEFKHPAWGLAHSLRIYKMSLGRAQE